MKKQKRGISRVIIALLLCFVMGISNQAFAGETIGEGEAEATEYTEYTEVAEEPETEASGSIEEAERQAAELEAERAATQANRDTLDNELNEIIESMIETSEALTAKVEEVEAAEFELVNALVDENNQYQNMMRRIQFMYENGGIQMLEMLLASESIADFVNQVEYINKITTADRELLVLFQDTVERVAELEASLREDEALLVELQNDLIAQEYRVQALLDEADMQLGDVHARIGANSALLADLVAQAEAERIRQEEAAAAEAERIRQEEAAAAEAELVAQAPEHQEVENNENQNGSGAENENNGGYVSNPPPPPPPEGDNSWATTGTLGHPLPGAPITSPFGWRAFDNAHHNGVDFGAPEGTPIFAAEAGTVIISGFSHSAGNWVVINHGGGLVTMYMHNSVNQVSVGQQVVRGQQIALVGNTGNSFGAHLHFQVEINGVPVNPMQFL